MSLLNKWMGSLCASLVILLLQVIVGQYIMLSRYSYELQITDRARSIDKDQISDLMYQLDQLRDQQDGVAERNFVAGVTAAITKPDYYNEIWHAGYDRGSAVTIAANEVEKQSAYAGAKIEDAAPKND
jgi:hypothetical protein